MPPHERCQLRLQARMLSDRLGVRMRRRCSASAAAARTGASGSGGGGVDFGVGVALGWWVVGPADGLPWPALQEPRDAASNAAPETPPPATTDVRRNCRRVDPATVAAGEGLAGEGGTGEAGTGEGGTRAGDLTGATLPEGCRASRCIAADFMELCRCRLRPTIRCQGCLVSMERAAAASGPDDAGNVMLLVETNDLSTRSGRGLIAFSPDGYADLAGAGFGGPHLRHSGDRTSRVGPVGPKGAAQLERGGDPVW